MAHVKITELVELTDIADEDLIPVVDDPSGTPVTKYVTRENLFAGGQGLKLKRTGVNNTNYTILLTDAIVAVTSLSAPRTITLPTAASATGKVFILKDESGSANTHNLTLDGDGAETIDGAANKVLSTNYGAIAVYSNGTAWFTLPI